MPVPFRLALLTSALLLASVATADVAPVIPGYTAMRDSKKVDPAAQGDLLISELNCTACHAAPDGSRLARKGAPNLADIGSRATPQFLTEYLSNPHAAKPGTTMPELFHASAPQAKAGAVEFLVHFLVSQGGPIADPVGAGTPNLVESGRKLYHDVGCVACHAPEQSTDALNAASVPLGNLAQKTTQAALIQFLLDPTHTRPAGRMPAMNLNPVEARAIATYLLRDQMKSNAATTKPLPGTGVRYDYFEDAFITAKPDHFADGLKPKSTGKVPTFTAKVPGSRRDVNQYGIRFTGSIWIPRDGQYTFGLKSDDGAFLTINKKTLVSNDGKHPATKEKTSEPVTLKAGTYPIEVTYFQDGGGADLEVLWEGPGIPHQPLPADVLAVDPGKAMVPTGQADFELDPQKVQMGGQMFSMLGCAACHTDLKLPNMKRAKPLADLKPDNPEGCLAAANIPKGRPQYHLDEAQRAALAAALKTVATTTQPLDPSKKALHELASLNCLACHQRDGVGGPSADRNPLFKSPPNLDLGDEGRLPPRLTSVGAKLLPEAIERIVFKGELRVRPYYLARMPVFKKDALPDLADQLTKADAPKENAAASHGNEKDGRKLVGVKGLGCVNCHGVRGAKSLGVPAPDLSLERDRLQFAWFKRLLNNPNDVNPGTRMPAFWNDGESAIHDVADGKLDPQAAAIWAYVQQGPDMSLPEGLRLDDSDEIAPGDEVIVMRAFMTDVGPRAILVGNPEGIHWAFDANTMRLAKVWRGKFFDAAGIWEKRGGNARPPLGKDVLNLPAGPTFATLDSQGAPWPEPTDMFDRNLGGHFRGYTLDKQGRPTFRYTQSGIDIEELDTPVNGDLPALKRHFTLKPTTGANAKDLYLLLAAGKTIEPQGPNTWLIDNKQTVHLATPMAQPETREGKSGQKLLVLPVPADKPTTIDVDVNWKP